MSSHLPFSSLPLDPNGPPGNAWGRFGATDQLGMLNLLTPPVVAAAAKEIVSGVRISLDWPLNRPSYPSYGRDPLIHQIKQRGGPDRVVNDDILTFNTQSSTQWDGFRHYGYLKERRYYNNITHDQIHSSEKLGIDAWASNGGIVGRGILVDYCSWASKSSLPLAPLSSTAIPFSHLQRAIADQNVSFRRGDILFIRSGFTAAYNALSPPEKLALSKRPSADFMGVEPTEELLEWLWESQFAAVAGDAPAFECSPVGGGKGKDEAHPPIVLHEWLLGGWGMPIGEMFDLEDLAEHCRECGRWSFFLSSVPLKVPGGVASPSNAVAIF
ncbi:MAG: major facilitator superfamily transporter [Lasallia pustulata]|uniref:Major facilitator superfamily transporter n=1 Tax=Lasallia pustulata TaxID=136370 RepID=A0A5M8PR54_9LECA|nr:MAG: major facilitator superfamily transporter [Lasallia pustulata]